MYQDHSEITNPELLPWVEKLSGLASEQIRELISRPALDVPVEVRGILERHQWATASRAICMRTSEDDPEKWRNALPPDRVPIVLTFSGNLSSQQGYTPDAAPAADYNHFPNYKYIGVDEENRHQFINTVLRVKKDNPTERTTGSELVVILGEGKFVSLYLGNDGMNTELPKEFREVRLNKDLKTTYEEVIANLRKEIASLPLGDREKLDVHLINYRAHLAALQA